MTPRVEEKKRYMPIPYDELGRKCLLYDLFLIYFIQSNTEMPPLSQKLCKN